LILLVLTLIALNINLTSVACAVGPSVNPLQNRETLHVNIVLQWMYVSIFWTAKYERKSCLNWNGKPLECYQVLNWFFLPKPGCLKFLWIFNSRNHLKINISHILNPNLTKLIPLNHQDLSNNTKGTIQFLKKFQLQFNLIFNRNHLVFKNFCTASPNAMEPKPMHPPPHRELSKDTKNLTIRSMPVWWIS
jgi:hypothetical protein